MQHLFKLLIVAAVVDGRGLEPMVALVDPVVILLANDHQELISVILQKLQEILAVVLLKLEPLPKPIRQPLI